MVGDDKYNIHDVTVREVPFFTTAGNTYKVTRVTMYVGQHGPFTENFGTNERPDTPEAINIWKQQVVAKLMATA